MQNHSSGAASTMGAASEHISQNLPSGVSFGTKAALTYAAWGIYDCVMNGTGSLIMNAAYPVLFALAPAIWLLVRPNRIAFGLLASVAAFNAFGLGLAFMFGMAGWVSFVATLAYMGIFLWGALSVGKLRR